MSTPVCIIGTGYVGMASAIGLAELGSEIVGYDVMPDRIAGLQLGVAPYREARIDDLLRKNINRNRMRFTSDHADAVRGAGLILISAWIVAGPPITGIIMSVKTTSTSAWFSTYSATASMPSAAVSTR